MNLFDVTGINGSLFNWNNPQDGMSLLYSMRILALASKERNLARRLSEQEIAQSYLNNDFYSQFNIYCTNINQIINNHKYMDLNISDGYDLRGYIEGVAQYTGNSIAESLSWTFKSIADFLSLDEQELDFIKNNHLPLNHVSEKVFLVIMYRVLSCLSRRMHLNGIIYNRNIEYYEAWLLGYQEPTIYSKRNRSINPPNQTFEELAETCNNQFNSRVNSRILDYNGVLGNSNTASPFWKYTLGYSITSSKETIQRTLSNIRRRGGGSTFDYLGGMLKLKINNLCSTSDGLFYGQNAKNDGTYKAWIAGDTYSNSGWYDLQSVDGDTDESTFYSESDYQYKKIEDLPLSLNENGYYTTGMIKTRDSDTNSFLEITEPEQYFYEGFSMQVMPYGDINDEYYSDFITEYAN